MANTVSHPVAALRIRDLVIGQGEPKTIVSSDDADKARREITMRMRRFIANPDRNFVAIIKNGTIYKKTLQQAMVQFSAIDRSMDLAGFMR